MLSSNSARSKPRIIWCVRLVSGLVACIASVTVLANLLQDETATATAAQSKTRATAATDAERAAPAGAVQRGNYQIRCWQYGRLIIDENQLEAPPKSPAYALSLEAAEGGRGPLHLVDTKNALCLLKQLGGEVGRAQPAQ